MKKVNVPYAFTVPVDQDTLGLHSVLSVNTPFAVSIAENGAPSV